MTPVSQRTTELKSAWIFRRGKIKGETYNEFERTILKLNFPNNEKLS